MRLIPHTFMRPFLHQKRCTTLLRQPFEIYKFPIPLAFLHAVAFESYNYLRLYFFLKRSTRPPASANF